MSIHVGVSVVLMVDLVAYEVMVIHNRYHKPVSEMVDQVQLVWSLVSFVSATLGFICLASYNLIYVNPLVSIHQATITFIDLGIDEKVRMH